MKLQMNLFLFFLLEYRTIISGYILLCGSNVRFYGFKLVFMFQVLTSHNGILMDLLSRPYITKYYNFVVENILSRWVFFVIYNEALLLNFEITQNFNDICRLSFT